MKIVVTSVLVDDQDKALRFYTDVLGFEMPMARPFSICLEVGSAIKPWDVETGYAQAGSRRCSPGRLPGWGA
jgi:catechol 2,3-dioxygenase-like lactoylglutathione lyase family enzyme